MNSINVVVGALGKGISNYKTVVLKSNVPFQDQVGNPNTKYVVKYNYDLGGETFVLPKNCILEYDGGNIYNGTLQCRNTKLTGNYNKESVNLAVLSGTYKDVTLDTLKEETASGASAYQKPDTGIPESDLASSVQNALNTADEEDITSLNHVLKFKDKAYSAASYSGLGRKYLRKNMVNSVNILTQAMVNAVNTIYVIQYDYDLNNAVITVPSGCILKFDGGSLKNGSLAFNNTYIDAGYYKVFYDISYSGKVLNPINILWFGAVGDGVTNCDDAFAKAFRITESSVCENTIYVPYGTYLTTEPIYVRKGCKLIGENATSTNISYTGIGEAARAIVMGENENGADVGGHIPVVSDISILCPNGARGIYVAQSGWKIENTWFTCTVGIEVRGTDGVISKCVSDGGDNFVRLNDTGTPSSIYGNTHSIIISDCITYACNYASIYAKGSYGVIISNCAFYYSKKYGIAVEQECGGFIISNCEFRVSESAGYYDPDDNYHIWTSSSGKLTDSIISSCKFSCSRKGDIYMSASNTTIDNCYFRDSYGFGINLKDNGNNNRIKGCMFKSIAGFPIYSFARSIIADNEFNDISYTSETSYLNVCIINQGAGAIRSYVHDNYNYGDIAVASFINGASNCYSSNNISTGGSIDVIDYTSSLTSYNERKQS